MRTLNITISDMEYGSFGIPSEQLNFTDFVDIIGRELMRQNLSSSVALAEKYGLSAMTMEDITNEVRAARGYAKGSH
jgi:AcrR family transcriptional regulator